MQSSDWFNPPPCEPGDHWCRAGEVLGNAFGMVAATLLMLVITGGLVGVLALIVRWLVEMF